jgi:hypothetical protein
LTKFGKQNKNERRKNMSKKKRGLSSALKRMARGRYVEAKERVGQRAREWESRRQESRAIEFEAFAAEKRKISKKEAYARGIRRAQPMNLGARLAKAAKTGKSIARKIPVVKFDKHGNPIFRKRR